MPSRKSWIPVVALGLGALLPSVDASAQDLAGQRFEQQAAIAVQGEGNAQAGTSPEVALSAAGETFVIWPKFGLFGRRISPDGELGEIVELSGSVQRLLPEWPSACYHGNGEITIVWAERDEFGSPYRDIRVRRFDAAGSPLGPARRVNEDPDGDQTLPSLACAPDGRFVVVWQGPGVDERHVFARLFSSQGQSSSTEIQVNTLIERPVNWNTSRGAEVAMDQQGRFVVVWAQENGSFAESIFHRRFSGEGLPLDENQVEVVSGGSILSFFEVARHPSSGDFVVAWSEGADTGPDLTVRRYGSDGQPLGEHSLDEVSDDTQIASNVAFSGPDGAFVLAWNARGGEGPAVQRFLYPAIPGARLPLGENGHFWGSRRFGLAGKAGGELSAAWADFDPVPPNPLAVWVQRTIAPLFADGFESGTLEAWVAGPQVGSAPIDVSHLRTHPLTASVWRLEQEAGVAFSPEFDLMAFPCSGG